MMKAVVMHETGGPEVLQVEQIATPSPAAGQLLIRVAAAGINFTDVLARQGVYLARGAAPQLPTVPGTEVAGVVTAVGPGVSDDLVGRRVVAFVHGGYAEYAVAPTQLVTQLPDHLDLASAVAFLVQGVSAWQLLHDCGRLTPGGSVLVHSAAGGVGTLAVQLARTMGASRVVATAGSAEKRKLAQELGAEVTVDYRVDDWPQRVLEATDGRGVDIVLDAVGGDVGEQSLACLAAFGRLVVSGVASKRLASFAGSQLMQLNQSVVGYWLSGRLRIDGTDTPEAAGVVARLLELACQQRIQAVVRHVFPLEEAVTAHRAIAERRTVGKVVLTT